MVHMAARLLRALIRFVAGVAGFAARQGTVPGRKKALEPRKALERKKALEPRKGLEPRKAVELRKAPEARTAEPRKAEPKASWPNWPRP